jgi:N-acetylmuramoyl-L-alanine amidase
MNSPLIRRWALERLSRLFLIAAGVAMFGLLATMVVIARRPREVIAMAPQVVTMAPPIIQTLILLPTPTPTITPTPEPPPIALLAGHSGGSDPGAMCPDGLREVDVTTDVAQRAKTILQSRGYRVDILAEYDTRFNGVDRAYSPRAFLAIHADSCVAYASGFKVARAENSVIAHEDDRLVRCVTVAYKAATQLPFHEGSITGNMTRYHAFYKFNPQSPAAILELGFLGADKEMLRNRRDVLSLGIVEGIERFLRGEACQ